MNLNVKILYLSKEKESFAHLWCNHYPVVAWPHLVLIISHA